MSQKELVKQQLTVNGEVSRNWCLKNFITRLAAISNQLKKEGWNFETEERNGDFIYKVKKVKPIVFNQKGELKELNQNSLFKPRRIYEN